MRRTAIPLLRDLPSGVVIVRCPSCCEFVLMSEMCRSSEDKSMCLPRRLIEETAGNA
jgi:hypothetical protein